MGTSRSLNAGKITLKIMPFKKKAKTEAPKLPGDKPKQRGRKPRVEGERKKPKIDYTNFARYTFKVLKQVHPDTGISSKGMIIMNSLVNDLFERIASQASLLFIFERSLSSHLGISKPPLDFCCQENWPNMLCLREPRLSLNTPLRSLPNR